MVGIFLIALQNSSFTLHCLMIEGAHLLQLFIRAIGLLAIFLGLLAILAMATERN